MKIKHLLFFLFLPICFFSCKTLPKDIVYFQDIDNYQQKFLTGNDSTKGSIIKIYDELLITVSAPVLDQEIVAQFNLPPFVYLSPGATTIQQTPSIQTYTVGKDGTINFPIIGQVTLVGLSRSQAIEHIKSLISNHVDDPIVNLRIVSYKIAVLGEVFRPGEIYVNQERFSIFDAISAVGGLTIYGNRQNVLLIRENNGSIEHVRFDLTKSDLFSSPYYYLQQNDKIIVEPNKIKQKESKYGIDDNYKLSIYSTVFGTLISVVSMAIAIISLSKK